MTSISFDKAEYKAGETATITYTGAEGRGWIVITSPSPSRKTYDFTPNVGSGSFKWAIPTDAVIGEYIVSLYDGKGVKRAHDTATVSGGAVTPPVTPPVGFYDTGKVTPSTIEVDPTSGYYDVMFKLTGYKDKIITGVVIPEGATKTVSATLEPEGTPPVTPPVTPPEKGYLTVTTSPTGALVTVNGVSCGTTPVTRCVLSPGSYQLTITKLGYETVIRAVTIRAGETEDLGTITLTPTAAPPVTKKTVTFKSVPSGAHFNIVSR